MFVTQISNTDDTFDVRILNVEDCGSIMALEKAAHSHPWSEKIMRQTLIKHRAWGAFDGQKLVAFALVSQVVDEAELLDCVVSPDVQGRGIGSAFMAWVVDEVGVKAARFYLEVRQSNQSAIALYDKCGFIEVGVRHGYYPAKKGREDAVLMAMEMF